MNGSLNLGKVLGIKIQVHWTFTLILIWVAFLEIKNGGTIENVITGIIFIILLFVCVVLHEYGHILTARRFGVHTKNITLLPIGGVASMDTIPENPRQELLISIAGPAVNIAIALLLLMFIPTALYLDQNTVTIEQSLHRVTPQNLVVYLFSANIVLALFNFIPAFPMDGGRVLRAILAMYMSRVNATKIATGLGEILAFVFLIVGILHNPFLIIIALFIYFAAQGENKMVQQLALLKGHKVSEAMLTDISILRPDHTVENVIEILLAGTETNFVVVEDQQIIGMLYHSDIIRNSKARNTKVKDIMTQSYKTIDINDDLKEIFGLINDKKKDFFAVVQNSKLAGAIDLANVSEFMLLKSNLISKG